MKKFVGIIVNPVLFVLQIMIAFASVILLGCSIVGLFIEIPGEVCLFSTALTGIPRFIVMIVCSIFLFILAYLCHKLIKRIRGK